MKANIVFGDLNPCGGGERLSLITMHALLEMQIDFDLTTFRSPDLSKLENVYGKKLASVMKNIKTINIINILEELQNNSCGDYNYDITINTHGDIAPYYHASFSKDNAITYCHFPTAKYFIESENMNYVERDLSIRIMSEIHTMNGNKINKNDSNDSFFQDKSDAISNKKKVCFSKLKYGYWNLMRNSTVITNSEFSRRAIVNAFDINNIIILSPPIDIDTFRNAAFMSNGDYERSDIIIVISRIDPSKQIENAIRLAKILKDNNIGTGMTIIGSLYYYNFNYYSKLKQMVIDLDLSDYVTFEINASLDKLLSIMRKSKVYFHPMIEEHFGMAAVEAMAAGLIPIIPDIGGPTEFVPQKYHFHTLEEAAEIIASAFNLSNHERVQISYSVNKFSNSHYIKGFQNIVSELLSRKKKN